MQQGAVEIAAAMGVFVRANFQSVSQLSLALGGKQKELEKDKQELAEAQQRHEQQIGQLKQEHEDRVDEWKNKVEEVKHQLRNVEFVNQKQVEKIDLINQELKDVHLASKGSSFVDLIPKDFKQVLCKIHEEFRRL